MAEPAHNPSPSALLFGTMSDPGNTEARFARIDGKFEAVDARLDGLGLRLDHLDKNQQAGFDKLFALMETASIKAASDRGARGKFSWSQMGAIGAAVVTIGGVAWAGLAGPLHARIDAERAARVSTERLINDRLAHEREILRTIKPDAPEYRDVPGLE